MPSRDVVNIQIGGKDSGCIWRPWPIAAHCEVGYEVHGLVWHALACAITFHPVYVPDDLGRAPINGEGVVVLREVWYDVGSLCTQVYAGGALPMISHVHLVGLVAQDLEHVNLWWPVGALGQQPESWP